LTRQQTLTCVAVAYCKDGGGLADLTCDAVDGECPSFSACADSEEPSWLSKFQMGTKVNDSFDLSSGGAAAQ
jgi:hypothetical protein